MLTLFSIKFSPTRLPMYVAKEDCDRLIDNLKKRFSDLEPKVVSTHSADGKHTGTLEVQVDDSQMTTEDRTKVSFFAQGFMASALYWER